MKNARKASEILQQAGYKAYVVGGAVRDTIMGIEPKDWDLATAATPEQVMFLFGAYKVIPTGIEYGTVTVMMPHGMEPVVNDGEVYLKPKPFEPIEITTFRSDQTYSDGRRPDAVTFSQTIEEDLLRRDFTCNAIAWDIVNDEFVDPHHGREDIADGVLRCVGDPYLRFQEDGLRVMRALRFGATKSLEPTADTFQAIHLCAYMLKMVSRERIRDELLKILTSELAHVGLMWIQNLNVMQYICPEMEKQVGHKQNQYHKYDVWEHTLQCMSFCENNDPVMRVAVFLHDIAKPATSKPHPKRPGENQFLEHEDVGAEMAEAWMREYKFSNDEITRVRHIIQNHLIMYDSKWSNAAVRRWVQRVGKENIPDLICMARCDLLGKGLDVTKPLAGLQELLDRIANMKEPIVTKTNELAIDGHDVMAARGETKGSQQIGSILGHLMHVVTEDPTLNTREQLLRIVCETSGIPYCEGL